MFVVEIEVQLTSVSVKFHSTRETLDKICIRSLSDCFEIGQDKEI